MTFDDDVTILGDIDLDAMTAEGPFFGSDPNYGLVCNVETIILPKTITQMGTYAFSGCSGLSSIEIPDNATSIGEGAFYYCTGLTSVTIPNSVTVIGNWSFQNCSSLTAITIPNSVTTIGDYAFYNCAGLTSIICKSITPPTIENDVFYDTNDCSIYVPSQSVDNYKTSWSEYADRIIGLLNNNQIKYTANEQLTINDGIDYIEHTFEDGIGIVTFNNDLTELESSWFTNTFDNYLDNITSLTLPNGVSSISISSLNDTNTVYYEGTQKECARIEKDWFDGSGAGEYHCFDGIVNDIYNSNWINPLFLYTLSWLKDLIGEKKLNELINIIGNAKIDKYKMTAGEFITILVDGTSDAHGLSTFGFTVVNQEYEGVTIPLAYHTESGHFIGIVKAIDYAYVDLKHIASVAVNKLLDPDYMYVLLDDTIIKQVSAQQ